MHVKDINTLLDQTKSKPVKVGVCYRAAIAILLYRY